MSTAVDTERASDLTKPGETLFAWSIFPLTMVGCVALAIHLHHREADPLVALLVPLALGYAVVIGSERLYPYVKDWNRSHQDVPTDVAWWMTGNATGLALRPVAAFVAVPVGAWLSARFGAGLWPTEWPLTAQLALSFVIVEFFHYWAHRLMHERDLLWRFHATHHSAPRLYWLNANRFHVVDTAFLNLGFTIPLIALGADARVFSLYRFRNSLPTRGSRAPRRHRHRRALGLPHALVATDALAVSVGFDQGGEHAWSFEPNTSGRPVTPGAGDKWPTSSFDSLFQRNTSRS
jgi:hypothetical protein